MPSPLVWIVLVVVVLLVAVVGAYLVVTERKHCESSQVVQVSQATLTMPNSATIQLSLAITGVAIPSSGSISWQSDPQDPTAFAAFFNALAGQDLTYAVTNPGVAVVLFSSTNNPVATTILGNTLGVPGITALATGGPVNVGKTVAIAVPC